MHTKFSKSAPTPVSLGGLRGDRKAADEKGKLGTRCPRRRRFNASVFPEEVRNELWVHSTVSLSFMGSGAHLGHAAVGAGMRQSGHQGRGPTAHLACLLPVKRARERQRAHAPQRGPGAKEAVGVCFVLFACSVYKTRETEAYLDDKGKAWKGRGH